MILATKRHEGSTPDASLLLDIDLSVLGANAATFQAYDAAIKQEYAWVPEDQYRAGRAKVLGGFLARDAIYRTPTFRAAYESRARENLTAALAELRE